MEEFSDSSQRSIEIICSNDGIAFQTNILALNTAEVAKEIRAHISSNVERFMSSSQLVKQAYATMM